MALIQGTNNSDNLYNPPTDDTVYLGGGDDRFQIGVGNDTVSGGSGSDTLFTDIPLENPDVATVFGESGDDFISALYITGGSKLYGGDGFDTISGGGGNDTILGGNDNDILRGGLGNDRLYGEEGNDLIQGNYVSDTLVGGNGNDTLSGKSIDETSNFTFGIDDRDVLYGGSGSDTFVLSDSTTGLYYELNGDADFATIEDFKSGEDRIQLAGYPFFYTLTRVGSDTNISIDKGENNKNDLIAIVKNSSGLSLGSSDFTFKPFV